MQSSENKNFYRQKSAYILDNHLLFAESFSSLLKSFWLFDSVSTGDDEKEMLRQLKAGAISHLFLNFNVKGFRTEETINTVRQWSRSVNIIIITDTDNMYYLRRMIAMDANAFISTRASMSEIDNCIQSLKIGRSYICKCLRELIENDHDIIPSLRFTIKELQVLQLMAKGFTINETAAELCLSKHTIVSHRRKLMNKSGLKTATGLVKFAIVSGYVD